MKFEHFINDEDREMIEGFIQNIQNNPKAKENDSSESGGLGVRLENIDSKTGELLFTVYQTLAYVCKKNRFHKKGKFK
jgi:hypothetical protein